MISFFENLSPEILIFIGATLIFFGILNLLILILLKKRWQKKEKTTSPPTSFSLSPPPSSLTIQISEQFQKNLENLILQETSRNLAIAKEKTLRDQEKISQMYLEAVEKFIENLRTKKEEIGNVTAQLLEEFQKEILKTKETIKKESF
ncbi:hypothetical protein H5T58_00100, partial [Candidatus Parcubacteria bacterium]|nr:hypothetical protein [Candidatus Parcubacteria bacterium]